MTKREELKTLILRALDEPVGLVFRVDGQRKGLRTLALAALAAAKRELAVDVKEVLDLAFKSIPGTPDEIAIVKLTTKEEDPLSD